MTTLDVFAPRWFSASYVERDDESEARRFAADVEWVAAHGVPVTLATLSEEPGRFVEHDAVRFLMNLMGTEVLPVILVDGVMRSHGTYPSREALAAWAGIDPDLQDEAPPAPLVSAPAPERPVVEVLAGSTETRMLKLA